MKQTHGNPMTSQPTVPRSGVRAGFMLGATGVFMAVCVAGWFLRPRPTPPPQAEVPPPAAEAPAADPVPSLAYAPRAAQRDYAKRRGAPRRTQTAAAPAAPKPPPPPSLEQLYGIQVCGMRLSMGGRYLDLRYKVLDAEKALRLGQGKTPSYLVDDASGTKLLMPRPPAEGAFPPTGNKLAPGRMYYAMIANPNGKIQSGSQLAFQVSGAGPTNLVVQ